MAASISPRKVSDPFDLQRFVEAQDRVYDDALGELRDGRKRSHWMWFIFPQIAGLGSSPTAQHYAISGLAEAEAYLDHPLLGRRLVECIGAAMAAPEDRSAHDIFGAPDDLKFRSSLTLFEKAAKGAGPFGPTLFDEALDRFYDGHRDQATLDRL